MVTSAIAWLCSCLRGLDAGIETPGPPPVGWDRLLAVVEAEGLAPALALWLERHPRPDVPPPVAARLREGFRQALACHVVMSRDLGRLLRRLAEERIPAIPLKGAFLSETVYPHPALRPLSDIDVLVRAEDRLRVDAALRGLGYSPGIDAHSLAFDLAYDGATFYDGPGGARVDVHWRLLNDPRYPWDERETEAVWRRAVPVTLAGESTLALAPEDLVLYLAAHLAIHHGLSGLLWYWDLALLFDRWATTLDWDVLVDRASRWKVRHALASVLRRLGALFVLPDEVGQVADRLQPSGPRAMAVRWMLAHRESRLRRFEHVLPLLLTDRLPDMLRALGPAVWPSPAWVRARYGATTSVPGAYLAHCGRLAVVLASTGRSLLMGRASSTQR